MRIRLIQMRVEEVRQRWNILRAEAVGGMHTHERDNYLNQANALFSELEALEREADASIAEDDHVERIGINLHLNIANLNLHIQIQPDNDEPRNNGQNNNQIPGVNNDNNPNVPLPLPLPIVPIERLPLLPLPEQQEHQQQRQLHLQHLRQGEEEQQREIHATANPHIDTNTNINEHSMNDNDSSVWSDIDEDEDVYDSVWRDTDEDHDEPTRSTLPTSFHSNSTSAVPLAPLVAATTSTVPLVAATVPLVPLLAGTDNVIHTVTLVAQEIDENTAREIVTPFVPLLAPNMHINNNNIEEEAATPNHNGVDNTENNDIGNNDNNVENDNNDVNNANNNNVAAAGNNANANNDNVDNNGNNNVAAAGNNANNANNANNNDNDDELDDNMRERTRFEFSVENWFFVTLFVILFLFITDIFPILCGRFTLYIFGLQETVKRLVDIVITISEDIHHTGIINHTSTTTGIIPTDISLNNPIPTSQSTPFSLYDLIKPNMGINPQQPLPIQQNDVLLQQQHQYPYRATNMLDLIIYNILQTSYRILLHLDHQSSYTFTSMTTSQNSMNMYNKLDLSYSLYNSIESVVGILCFLIFLSVVFLVLVCRHIKNIPKLIKYVGAQIWGLIKQSLIATKAFFLFSVELVITPIFIGFLFMLISLKIFQATLLDRIDLFYLFPVLCLAILWVVGACIIFHFGLILMTCKSLLKEDIFGDILPHFRDFDGFIEVLASLYENAPFIEHIRRILINHIFLLISFMVIIFIPVRFGHILMPFGIFPPLTIKFNKTVSDVEKSVELLVSHLLLPILIERTQTDAIDRIFRAIFQICAQIMDVGGIILNPDVFPFVRNLQQQPQPAQLPQQPPVQQQQPVQQQEEGVPPLQQAQPLETTTETIITEVNHDNNNEITESSTLNDDSPTSSNNNSSNMIPTTNTATASTVYTHYSILSYFNIKKYPSSIRICLFVLLVLLLTSCVYTCLIHVPLNLGRQIVKFVR